MRLTLITLPAAVVVCATLARGETHLLKKSVCGAGQTQSSNRLMTINGTFGQTAVGYATAGGDSASLGFWTGDEQSDASGVRAITPGGFTLLSSAPNPFRRSTEIHFTLPAARDIELKLYAEDGALVRTTRYLQCPAGMNEQTIIAGGLPSGTYRCTLSDGRTTLAGKLTIVK